MIEYVTWLMNTYNFEQKIVNLRDSMEAILPVKKQVKQILTII